MIALDNIQPEEKNEKADDKQENKESVDKNTLAQQAKDKHESMVKDFAQGIHNYTDQKTGKIFEVKIENNDMVLGVLDHGNKEILFTSKIDNLGDLSVSINGAGNARYDSRTKEYTGSDNGIKRVNQFLDQCRSYLQKADIQKEQKTVDQDYATKLEDAYK